MSTLWGRLRGGRSQPEQRHIVTLEDYVGTLAELTSFGQFIPGVTQTAPGNRQAEPIPTDFRGLATSLFGSSSVVFACMLARLSVFSMVRFQYQRFVRGRPSDLFGDPSLGILERPWPGGVTADLLATMIIDADLAGNAYITRDGSELVRLRPDWVDIVLVPRVRLAEDDRTQLTMGWRKAGYVYYEDGIRGEPGLILLPDEVCHFAPMPDPLASYRGMSWLTPVIREAQADKAMTRHKQTFMDNAATPNMVVRHLPTVTPKQARAFKEAFTDEYEGPGNAGKTMHLGGGADLTVVGRDFQQIDLRAVQGAGETRIAAAAGVPPIIAGFSEGLSAATYSNFGQARRRFADGTLHPLWCNVAGSLEQIRPAPGASRLWYDARDVPFLREDSADQAKITSTLAQTIRAMVDGGFTAESSALFAATGDPSVLEHTGRVSVQLQKPGESSAPMPADDMPADDMLAGRALAPVPTRREIPA